MHVHACVCDTSSDKCMAHKEAARQFTHLEDGISGLS